MATFILVVLAFLVVSPIYHKVDTAEGTATASTTTLSITSISNTASVDVTPVNSNGTFISSSSTVGSEVSFSVTTNNLTGYTLAIDGNTSTGELANADTGAAIDTLSSATDENTFRTGASSTYTNKWGLRPSKLNGVNNTNYLPAPNTTDPSSTITIEETTAPNTTANNYTIGIGTRIDYTKPSGTYTNVFTIEAVTKPVLYEINYSDTTGDSTVAGIPANDPGTSVTQISGYTLNTATPTRTGYSFAGWCDGTVTHTASANSSCSGTTYAAGASYNFSSPSAYTKTIVNLKAMWNVNSYTCTKRYRLQDQNGNYPTSYTADGTQQVAYGTTCTYTKTVTDYNSNAAKTSTCTITTSGCTASLDFPRNTYALTVNRNTTYISAASGGGTYRWGQSVAISATVNYGYFNGWTVSSGSSGSFASASSASTTYTMPKGNSTIYANGACTAVSGAMQNFTGANNYCLSGTLTDNRDNQNYTVAKINGGWWMTRNIAIGCNGSGGSYGSGRTTRSLTSSNSNVSTTWSTGSAGALTSGDSYDEPRMQCNSTYGAWYNYAATTANTIKGSSNTTNASNDICPSRWRLPTKAEQSGIISYRDAYKPVLGGYYQKGSVTNTDHGYWYSSTSYSATHRETLNSGSTTMYMNESGSDRVRGRYVRCKLK